MPGCKPLAVILRNTYRMKITKTLYYLSLVIGIFLTVSGTAMKFLKAESQGWFFTKQGNLISGRVDANGTIVLGTIVLCFSIWWRKELNRETSIRDRLKNIESNEQKLRKRYSIYKLRKINK